MSKDIPVTDKNKDQGLLFGDDPAPDDGFLASPNEPEDATAPPLNDPFDNSNTASDGLDPLPAEPLSEDDPNREKSGKVLTSTDKSASMKPVRTKSRKDAKKMTNQKTNKISKMGVGKSLLWLVQAGFSGFVCYVMLSQFDHLVTTIAGVFAGLEGAVIVIVMFVLAHKN